MRSRWATATVAAFLICIFCFFFADRLAAVWIHQNSNTVSDLIFESLTRLGQSEWYLVPGFLMFIFFRKHRPCASLSGLFVFYAVAISGLAADALKYLLPRARPGTFFSEGIYGFRVWPLLHGWDHSWNSFPSGHAATAFSAAVVFCILFPRFRYIFLAAAALIAFSRVVVTEHYVSDVIAGSFLGAVTSIVLHKLYFSRKFDVQNVAQI